ncbi:MAG: hypothetical protein ACLVJ6_04560 [Merdibacter sp.]
MPHDELKPKDRVVLRMTRDGAVEENLTEGTSEKCLCAEAQLVAPHDMETGDLAEEVEATARPDELERGAKSQAAPSAILTSPLHSETYRAHSVD